MYGHYFAWKRIYFTQRAAAGGIGMEVSGVSLKTQILRGTVILAAAGIITRILGLYNRVFLANTIGAGQMGIYQLIFPVFMVCNAVCCSGIETALSRLTAAYGGQGRHGNIRRLVRIGVCTSMALACILAAGVYFLAGPVSIYILKEPGCKECLKVLAFVIPFSTAHSCVLGYFYGTKQTLVPGISQLIEQICRVSAIYILSVSLFYGSETGAVLAVWGMVAGDGISCIYTLISYKIHVKRLQARLEKKQANRENETASGHFLFRQLMGDALPLTINRLSLTVLQSIESILIPSMLKLYYTASGEAMEIYGVVTGMAMPFITFPSTLTNALASMLLPTVAEAAAKNDYGLVKRAVSKSIHYCLLIGIFSMSIFVLYGNSLGMVFFKDEMAGQFLTSFALLCPFIYMSAALASVLNGLGKTRLTLLHNVLSVGVRIFCVVILVPKMGITGYFFGMLLASLLLCGLHTFRIFKLCGLFFSVMKSLVLPAICVSAAGYVSLAVYRYILSAASLPQMAVLLIPCGCMAVVYMMGLTVTKSLEWK